MKQKRLLLFLCLCIGICGCGNQEMLMKDSRGLYLISDSFSIYSDEEDPHFMEYGEKTSIKTFLPQSNCLPDCIHGKETPSESNKDATIYEYMVEDDLYYFIQCHKSDSKYNNGKDILIGKNKEKLLLLC